MQGRVVWQNEDLDDLVLLRSDGNAHLYAGGRGRRPRHGHHPHHPRRRSPHQRAPRQKQIYDALGWDVPVMAHIPLIHGPDGSKLSKRHGALGVDAYRAHGLSAGGMRNYLVRLGWSAWRPGNLFDRGDGRRVRPSGRSAVSPARFDFAKLESLNGHYIRADRRCGWWIAMRVDALVLPQSPAARRLAAKLTPRQRA